MNDRLIGYLTKVSSRFFHQFAISSALTATLLISCLTLPSSAIGDTESLTETTISSSAPESSDVAAPSKIEPGQSGEDEELDESESEASTRVSTETDSNEIDTSRQEPNAPASATDEVQPTRTETAESEINIDAETSLETAKSNEATEASPDNNSERQVSPDTIVETSLQHLGAAESESIDTDILSPPNTTDRVGISPTEIPVPNESPIAAIENAEESTETQGEPQDSESESATGDTPDSSFVTPTETESEPVPETPADTASDVTIAANIPNPLESPDSTPPRDLASDNTPSGETPTATTLPESESVTVALIETDAETRASEPVESPGDTPELSLSADATDHTPETDAKPAPVFEPTRAPEPLTSSELLTLAVASLLNPRRPISEGIGFISVYNDFDADGLTDIAIVSVELPTPAQPFRDSSSRTGNSGEGAGEGAGQGAGQGEDPGASTNAPEADFPTPTHHSLSNPVRLFASEVDSYVFYLGTYLQRDGDIQLYSEDLLGSYVVFEGIELIPITGTSPMPAALVATFQTRQGSVDEWVVFSSAGITRLTLRERMGSRNTIGDIDGDGVLDIVLADQSFEVGIGFETFLSWLEWSGTGFELSASANVVRSVHRFLSDALGLLERGDYAGFGDVIGSGEPGSAWRTGESRERIFGEVFRLLPSPSGFANRSIEPDETIRRIVHAEILENPFSQSDAVGDFFPLTFRFETEAGSVHLYGAKLYMAKNPFTERQFFFAPNARR